jgi:predicted amidophosphoribosyltransferase
MQPISLLQSKRHALGEVPVIEIAGRIILDVALETRVTGSELPQLIVPAPRHPRAQTRSFNCVLPAVRAQ